MSDSFRSAALEYVEGCTKLLIEKIEILMTEILRENSWNADEAKRAGVRVIMTKTMQPGETIALVTRGDLELGRVEGRIVADPHLRYEIKVFKVA